MSPPLDHPPGACCRASTHTKDSLVSLSPLGGLAAWENNLQESGRPLPGARTRRAFQTGRSWCSCRQNKQCQAQERINYTRPRPRPAPCNKLKETWNGISLNKRFCFPLTNGECLKTAKGIDVGFAVATPPISPSTNPGSAWTTRWETDLVGGSDIGKAV